MDFRTHLRTLMGARAPEQCAQALGLGRATIYSWLTEGERSWRTPAPRHLSAFLDLVGATEEQRALAWSLLAKADALRASRQEAA